MPNEPGIVKRNPLTEIMDQVKEVNAERGAPAGRVVGAGMVPIAGGPRVRTPAILAEPRPLTDAEVQERDAKLVELGILPAPEGGFSEPLNTEIVVPRSVHGPVEVGQGQYVPSRTSPRLLDFTKLESINLVNGTVIVDGVSIPLEEEKIIHFRNRALESIVDYITKQLTVATEALLPKKEEGVKEDGGKPKPKAKKTKKVQQLSKGSSETVKE